MRLDIIVTFNTDGTRNSLEAYTYDDAYRNFHHTQARYNPSTDSWEATTEYDYRLTDDNVLLLISTLTHSTNEYVIYEYDDQGWCVERRMYYKNDENTWTEQKKTEYTHDERGNTTEEMTYRLVDGQWKPSVHFIMAYDSNNRQILREFGISLKQNQLLCMFNGIPLQCFRLIVIKAICRQCRNKVH